MQIRGSRSRRCQLNLQGQGGVGERENRESSEAAGFFLSVGGRDLVLDLADLPLLVVARYFVEY